MPSGKRPLTTYQDLQAGIIALLEAARTAAARSVNTLMTATYWEVGRRIVEADQQGVERAAYGKVLIPRLATDLTRRFGRGFSERNLEQMRQFYLCWPISQTLSAKSSNQPENNYLKSTPEFVAPTGRFPLPWSAYVRLLSVAHPEARAFYEREALRAGWSVRQLDRQIDSQFFERAALSRNKAKLLQREEQAKAGDVLTPEEAIRDPFVLEFLNLKDEYSEAELDWMHEGENPSVGLILCAAKGAGAAHYALDNLPNKVLAAQYQTMLPDVQSLAAELERTQRELDLRRKPAPTLRTRHKSLATPRKEKPNA